MNESEVLSVSGAVEATTRVTAQLIERLLGAAPMELMLGVRDRVLGVNPSASLRLHAMFSKREGRVLHLFVSEEVQFGWERKEVFLDASGVHSSFSQCVRTSDSGGRFTKLYSASHDVLRSRLSQMRVRYPQADMVRLGLEIESVLDAFESAYRHHLSRRAEGQCELAKTVREVVMLPIERASDALAHAIVHVDIERMMRMAVYDVDAFYFEPWHSDRGSVFALGARSGSIEVLRKLALVIPPESRRASHFAGAVGVAYAQGDAELFKFLCQMMGEACFSGSEALVSALLIAGDREALRAMLGSMRFEEWGRGGEVAVKVFQQSIPAVLKLMGAERRMSSQSICSTLVGGIDGFAGLLINNAPRLRKLRDDLVRAGEDEALCNALADLAMKTSVWVFNQLPASPARYEIVASLLDVYRDSNQSPASQFIELTGVAKNIDAEVLMHRGNRLSLMRRCVERGNEAGVTLLVKAFGASPAAKGSNGRTLVQLARNDSMRRLLRELASDELPPPIQ